MKKLTAFILAVLMIFTLAACGEKTTEESATSADSAGGSADTEGLTAPPTSQGIANPNAASVDNVKMPIVLNDMEYVLYTNIFYNKMGDQFNGKPVEKTGVFTYIDDAFNSVRRYYVWGYYDATRCCDWQWEIKFGDTLPQLPPRGSRVKVSGTFGYAEDALDKYWITSPELEVVKEYTSPWDCDVDTCTMSATLERVQQQNLNIHPEYFEGQSVAFYGRVAGPGQIQHPYYDGAWQQSFGADSAELPAIGTMVVLTGTAQGGVVTGAKLEVTDQF